MKNGLSKNGKDERAKNTGDDWLTAVFNKANNIAAGEIGDNGNRKRDPNNHTESTAENIIKFSSVAAISFFGKFWEECSGDSDAN